MIIPAKYDITIKKGGDFSQTFIIESGGVALDYTGATILAQARTMNNRTSTKIVDFSTAIITAENELGETVPALKISLLDSVTSGIVETYGYYDVLVIDSSDNDTYYIEGKVTFKRSVTVKV